LEDQDPNPQHLGLEQPRVLRDHVGSDLFKRHRGAMNRNVLWRVSDSGKHDDWGRALFNGLSNSTDDPTAVCWWRYGKWIPEVACSLLGNYLMVSEMVKDKLLAARASFHRVKSLFVTDREVDWRSWPNTKASLKLVRDKYDINESEELCCPSGDGKPPDQGQSLDLVRPGLVELRDPNVWIVYGENSLQARRETTLYCVGRKGSGIYQDPFLYRNNVCVEPWVRDVLEAFGALETLQFKEIDAEWKTA
jgi:phosphatidylserine/phosphatidylglycerophosphate/cardiolipin synthase-like enzyme